jgi:hypothetical protein
MVFYVNNELPKKICGEATHGFRFETQSVRDYALSRYEASLLHLSLSLESVAVVFNLKLKTFSSGSNSGFHSKLSILRSTSK